MACEQGAAAYRSYGWQLAGAWTTTQRDEDEAILLWAVPTWQAWADAEKAQSSDDALVDWRMTARSIATDHDRIVLVDSPLCPFRTGRQPHRDDRVDWQD